MALDDFGLRVGRYLSTLPTLTNEEIAELQLDASGRLIISGRVLGGDVAAATDAMINVGAIRQDAEGAFAAVADGDYSPLQTDSNGRLKVATVVSVEGSDAEYAEDSAHTDTDTGLHILAVRQDTLASSTDADGDYASFKLNASGELYVADTAARTTLTNIDTSLNNIETDIGNLTHVEDTAHTTGDSGVMTLAVRADADGTLVDTDGDYAPLQVDADGKLKTVTDATLTPPGSEQYTITDALAAEGDGLDTITSTATPYVTVASLSHTSGTAYIYGWQWVCDQNAEARITTENTSTNDTVVYKVSANSSSMPSVSEHWDESGRIEIAGAANIEIRVQIKKRKAAGGDANGGASLHIRTV